MYPENMARAAVLGLACTAADALDDLRRVGVEINTVTVVGGGARSSTLCQGIADLTGLRVERPPQREYAARGAARQALWALTGDLPDWGRDEREIILPANPAPWMEQVRRRHTQLSAQLFADPTQSG